MRWAVAALLLIHALPAHAECTASPGRSAARAASDVPYDVPKAENCPAPPAGSGLEPHQAWAQEPDELRGGLTRLGALAVALGGLLLTTGATFAICAHADGSTNPNGFCHAARDPLLISGAVIAGLGLGTLAVATWVLPEREADGRTSLSAGAELRLAWDFSR